MEIDYHRHPSLVNSILGLSDPNSDPQFTMTQIQIYGCPLRPFLSVKAKGRLIY